MADVVVPLSQNLVFAKLAIDLPSQKQKQTQTQKQKHDLPDEASSTSSPWRLPLNLIAYDRCGRLFVWNSSQRLLHCVEIDQPETSSSSSSSTHSEKASTLLSRKNFKTLRPDIHLDFQVRFLSFNRRGLCLVLAGDVQLAVINLTSQLPSSSEPLDSSSYNVRALIIGGDKFQSSSKALRILQVSWHPYSDTHLGVLSSDGVFRLFDLSLNAESPEQEYHLQSQVLDRSIPATYARPVAFSFGGEHLWDRFTVFILFSTGAMYALCPISPFGSLHNIPAIEEIYKDACQWASQGGNPKAVSNASFAAAWLEAVFPCLISHLGGSSVSVWKAFPHVPFNSSLCLQGPLPVIMGADIPGKTSPSKSSSPASMLMYSIVGKDSILSVSFRDGQMHLYALADEVQPVWNEEIPPRVQVSDEGFVLSVGMLAETREDHSSSNQVFAKDGITKDQSILEKHGGVWTCQLPPLLQLAVIDFALPTSVLDSAPLSMLADPVTPERLYCHHAAGIDAILLQWLPFSEQPIERASSGRPPIVYPILDTCPGGRSVNLPLLGVTEVLDCYGDIWLVAVTSSCECVVIGIRSRLALDPLQIDGNKNGADDVDNLEAAVPQVISKELLQGPKDIPIPNVLSLGRVLTTDSIEGREFLHDQWKLLHEKYIEYAHRVHVELTSHGIRLHKVVQDQQRRLSESQSKMTEALQSSNSLHLRIAAAFQKNKLLKARVKKHSSLLAIKQKPLTYSEREYKSQLDFMMLHDLDILHNVVDVLKDQMKCQLNVSADQTAHSPSHMQRQVVVPDVQLNRLKQAVKKLTETVELNMKQVKRIEDIVKKRELAQINV